MSDPKLDIHISLSGSIGVDDFAKIAKLVTPHPRVEQSLGAEAAAQVENEAPKTTKTAAKPKPEPTEEPAAAATGEISQDDMVGAAQKYVKDNGREALASLLAEFGAGQLTGVPDDQRAEFHGRLTA